ncbi:MAG: hydroxysqualene dehydroxylase HpnE [Burkholderiales bacterium]
MRAERLAPRGCIAVIGAGWAGMAAAVSLAEREIPVTVFEASRTLGGRARRVTLDGIDLDNGQHVLLGAYRETLRLMRKVGADPERLLLRLPLELRFADGFHLRAPRLPYPVNLLAAIFGTRSLGLAQSFGAARFVAGLRMKNFRIEPDRSVARLLDEWNQAGILRSHLWEPLCVSALNTPVGRASAQVFANVLRDGLADSSRSSDLLIGLADLSRLFPDPAAAYLRTRGGTVCTGSPIKIVTRDSQGFQLDDRPERYAGVIVACAPQHASPLLAAFPELATARALIERLDYEPIVTCYLRYAGHLSLPSPMLGFAGGILQWLFDRQRPGSEDHAGLVAAVTSGSGAHEELDRETLASRIDSELRAALPGLPSLRSSQVIVEKRATFSCRPALRRPEGATPVPGLMLAGDYIAGPHPATLEAAVRSGVQAARCTSDGNLAHVPGEKEKGPSL